MCELPYVTELSSDSERKWQWIPEWMATIDKGINVKGLQIHITLIMDCTRQDYN